MLLQTRHFQLLSLIYHATLQTIVLAPVWSCAGSKTGSGRGDQLLQISQTRASPSPGSLACIWLMHELRVLSVGSTEGTEPSCKSDLTTDSSGDSMQLWMWAVCSGPCDCMGTTGVSTECCSSRTSHWCSFQVPGCALESYKKRKG